jgi:hypothetical protein
MVRKKEFIFSWDNLGNDADQNRLREFLKEELNIEWAENAKIEKIDDQRIKISKDENTAEMTLDKKAVLNFSGGRKYNLQAREEDGIINIYKEMDGIGNSPMGRSGIILITLYNMLLLFILLAGIILILPTIEPGMKTIPILNFNPSLEARMVLIVALSGALGGLVHSLRSFYWYLGNRELVWSWLGMYILVPFVGTALGVVFYLIIRGGFFSPQATVEQTSPFGFAALAALVGLFSEQAVLKLKKVAETVLTEAAEGKNAKPQETQKKG